jgi:hypothetical protein
MLPFPAFQLKEILFSSQSCFMFPKNFFMLDLVDDAVQQLLSTGMIQHLKENNERLNRPKRQDPKGLQVLSVEDLKYGFIIWLVTCGVSLAAFLTEILVKFIWEVLKKFCGIMVILIGLKGMN